MPRGDVSLLCMQHFIWCSCAYRNLCGEKECLRLLLFLAFSCIYTSFVAFSLHFLCIVCSPFPDTIPHQISTVLFFWLLFLIFYFILQIVYNLNVDPIVYLSILIYPWSTNLPVNRDHRDREILKNRQIIKSCFVKKGTPWLPRLAFWGYLIPRLPSLQSNQFLYRTQSETQTPPIISGIVGEPRAANRTLNSKPSGCTSLARIASSVGNQGVVWRQSGAAI